jgi:hypothetical protein
MKFNLRQVGLGWVRLVMRMRRGPWFVASLSLHLTISSYRHAGIIGYKKLQTTHLQKSSMAQTQFQIS